MDNPFDMPADTLMGMLERDPVLAGEGRVEAGRADTLIPAAGAYPDIPMSAYHGPVEICPGPSISSTGLKKLVAFTEMQSKGCSPRHFWEGSSLNPNRKVRAPSDALRMGAAFHDALLEPHRWVDPDCYHRLPVGFSRAAKVKMADEIAEADAAIAAGKVIISPDEHEQITAMVKAMRGHKAANAVLTHGVCELTLAWQDSETGVWCRARPDFIPLGRPIGVNVKTAADASFAGFQSDVTKYRYAQSAALEMDGLHACENEIRALFPDFVPPTNYLHPVVEKPGTGWEPGDYLPVALWELPAEDIAHGRALNRRALNLFAKCLSEDHWPGYADVPAPCGFAGWARKTIDQAIEREVA